MHDFSSSGVHISGLCADTAIFCEVAQPWHLEALVEGWPIIDQGQKLKISKTQYCFPLKVITKSLKTNMQRSALHTELQK